MMCNKIIECTITEDIREHKSHIQDLFKKICEEKKQLMLNKEGMLQEEEHQFEHHRNQSVITGN
jgi:hypothetical protein